ncbi:TorD/DmsD family molecular chaperone [Desulfosporosinus nitroreducens]|uniref:TorD/DmsD family molecular chaperone n=1 Tax=Desulfosporosinus nitroreducens TaxID=2018668 RepID=UPI00207CA25F|nr:molecular chaperone TorD family protein [Desulfosporosinus nitroreducens]MCO1601194.1 molecular chaperone TorD family protein [Desulfosporosinus nitroreducens]
MNTIQEQKLKEAFATSDFFQLLSLSLRLPTIELAEALLDGSYRQDGINILEELSCSQGDLSLVSEALDRLKGSKVDATPLLIEMRREYTRLFDDPKQPALNIYETLFLHPEDNQGAMLFISPTALNVERCYREAGVSLVRQSAEPADHMATELEFMMYLYGKKGQALQEQNNEELEKIAQQIQQFEEMHLKKWCVEFFNGLQTESTSTSYQALAKLAKTGLGHLGT